MARGDLVKSDHAIKEQNGPRIGERTTALTIVHPSHFMLPIPEGIESEQNLAPLDKLLVARRPVALLLRHTHPTRYYPT